MNPAFKQFLKQCQDRVEPALAAASAAQCSEFASGDSTPLCSRLHEAMAYCLLNGGKRVRATLVYASADAAGVASPQALDQVAASIECLHAYSLIHDDLPAMDDDDLRRGRPSCHKAFGEASAILTGDALQTQAFELLANCPELAPECRIELVSTLAAAAGARGMVGGQYIDIYAADHEPELALLETIHCLKTGALIRASIAMGAIAAGASAEVRHSLDQYGRAIGLAFQVKDDLLDIESSTEILGKQQGSDQAQHKMTYPALLGTEASRQHLAALQQQALEALLPLGHGADHLRTLADYIVQRSY